jgi:hypothetical protein
MASWRYALMFGGTGCAIRAERSISVLSEHAFAFDSDASELVPFDDRGHYGEGGADIDLGRNPDRDLVHRLQNGSSISVQCRNGDFYVSCLYLLATSDPHIRFCWPKKLFGELSPTSQASFQSMLCDIATECSAVYVVIADDIPDSFEDYFQQTSGGRSLNRQGIGGQIIDVKELWVNPGREGRLAKDVRIRSSVVLANGFVKYEV